MLLTSTSCFPVLIWSRTFFFSSLFFFFSSRRRHTRYWRDWSSDVCSSDLACGDRRRYRRPSHSRPAFLHSQFQWYLCIADLIGIEVHHRHTHSMLHFARAKIDRKSVV